MLLSILIPNYGFNDSVIKCLNSIETQIENVNFDVEILICDQSDSLDRNSLLNFANEYRNIRILFLDVPNVLEARKHLLKNASGEYIFFVDSDDYIDDGFLSNIYETLLKNNYPDLLITSYYKETSNSCIKNGDLEYINAENFLKYFYCTDTLNTLWRKVFKREIYNVLDIESLNSINGDDWIISYSLIKNAKTICFDKSLCGYHYCVNEMGLTHTMTYERFLRSFFLKDDIILSSNLFDPQLVFKNKMTKFIGFSIISYRTKKDKKELKEAFLVVRDNLLYKFGINLKMLNGSKNKVLFILLKLKLFGLFYIALKNKSKHPK